MRIYAEEIESCWQRCLIKVAHHIVSSNNSESYCEQDVGSKVSTNCVHDILYASMK